MKTIFRTIYKTYINHTDAGGIVYHGNYLTFYENCRRDWFTALGFDAYFLAMEEYNAGNTISTTYHPVVSRADTRYFKPILLDMKITVSIDEIKIRPASLVFIQSIYSSVDQTKLSSSEITIACVKNETNDQGKKALKPARLPINLVTAIKNWNADMVKDSGM